MDNKRRAELTAQLAGLESNERNKLYKRASLMRKVSRKPARANRYVEDDDEAGFRAKPVATLTDLVLRLLEEELAAAQPSGPLTEGAVIWVGKNACRVQNATGFYECSMSPELAREQQTSVAVGDVVLFSEAGVVSLVRPRRTRLSRPDPDNPNIERVLVANVDVVVVTVSVKTPPLHPRLIDRFVLAIQKGGAEPLICVNKLDLLESDEEREQELAKLTPYRAAGLPVVECSTLRAEGLADLLGRLAGKTCAFVGHSGVGKSSLLNALRPDLGLDTGGVSQGYGRGRHTTTASSLFDLGNGTRLIDTPGIRSFGLWQLSPDELAGYFPEFSPYVADCRFRDCRHDREPHCAVKAAVADGNLSAHRYETYLRLLREA